MSAHLNMPLSNPPIQTSKPNPNRRPQDADMSHMAVLRVDGGAAKNDLLMQLQVCVDVFWGVPN